MHYQKYNNIPELSFLAKVEDIRLARITPQYPLPWPKTLTTLERYYTFDSEMIILAIALSGLGFFEN